VNEPGFPSTLAPEMLAAVETELLNGFQERIPPAFGDVAQMVRNHFGWEPGAAPGKRIRPLLTMLCAACAGGDWRRAVPAAASIEIIHNFSLVHDDIEDSSETRRGRPTMWRRWGIAQAVNTGDFLLVSSHLALRRLVELGVPPATAYAVQQTLDEACSSLTLGQHLDMAFEGHAEVSSADYLRMIEGKTAALLAAASAVGAQVAEAPLEARDAYFQFGRRLGMAFQLLDDLLGIWGAPDATGKSAADDLRQGKKTYPVVLGLQRSPAFARSWVAGRAASPDVDGLRRALEACGADRATRREAERFTQEAMDALQEAEPRRPASDELRTLAERLLRRDR
jgi:geranylgeranyl diphosphate synthase type I